MRSVESHFPASTRQMPADDSTGIRPLGSPDTLQPLTTPP